MDRIGLDELIARLQEAMKNFDRVLFDEEYQHDLGVACTQAQLAKLERVWGGQISPSYRAFMSRHNGWNKFDGDAKILSVEDFGGDWIRQRLEALSVLFYEVGPNPLEEGSIPIVLGEDTRFFLLADPGTMRANGETTFALYDLTRKHREFGDFFEFLEYRLAVLHEVIASELKGESDEDDDNP